ncbi:MAG: hypothetical protein ABWJ98_01005 [Hydrogenothermaceae bacterium]
MKKSLLVFTALFFASGYGFAENLSVDEKILQLETKIRELEKRVEALEKGYTSQNLSQPAKQQSTVKKTPLLKEGVPPIEYTLLEKKFHKTENRLVERDDKIWLIFNFTNNFSKQIDVIYGELTIYDKNGNQLLNRPIKIYKPLDFFSSGKIKPGETFRRTIEIIYDEDIPSLRYIKDAPLSDLKVELKFNKVEFSDGSVEFLD